MTATTNSNRAAADNTCAACGKECSISNTPNGIVRHSRPICLDCDQSNDWREKEKKWRRGDLPHSEPGARKKYEAEYESMILGCSAYENRASPIGIPQGLAKRLANSRNLSGLNLRALHMTVRGRALLCEEVPLRYTSFEYAPHLLTAGDHAVLLSTLEAGDTVEISFVEYSRVSPRSWMLAGPINYTLTAAPIDTGAALAEVSPATGAPKIARHGTLVCRAVTRCDLDEELRVMLLVYAAQKDPYGGHTTGHPVTFRKVSKVSGFAPNRCAKCNKESTADPMNQHISRVGYVCADCKNKENADDEE